MTNEHASLDIGGSAVSRVLTAHRPPHSKEDRYCHAKLKFVPQATGWVSVPSICLFVQGGSSGRGTLFVAINYKLHTKAQLLFQCQQKLVLDLRCALAMKKSPRWWFV